jgi:hypothetical protein
LGWFSCCIGLWWWLVNWRLNRQEVILWNNQQNSGIFIVKQFVSIDKHIYRVEDFQKHPF